MNIHDNRPNENKKPNRLIHEKSPYLLQHAYNPVDWYPWGDEAFERARKEDRPVFLSIGYSTCHWCHVMERESFEDAEAAALLNQSFVCIKVDREERPDIDSIYMNVCQAMTGSGGWPLTIIMTPDKKPFFSGTYFPKEDRYGRIGLMELTRKIIGIWKDRRDEVMSTAEQITQSVRQGARKAQEADLGKDVLKTAFSQLENRYESEYGGFSQAPKFPTPHNFLFLLRYYKRTGNERALGMAEHTLQEMSNGGIYDHLGFGFHRYSTDQHWLVPHFEKMLYDQAMLVTAYAELYQATGNDGYKKTAKEILTYVQRDMTHPEGGFYSAEDADSEGIEGKFYVWTAGEIQKPLYPGDAELFMKVYNCGPEGNFLEESTRQKTGANIPHLDSSLADSARDLNMPEETLRERLERIRVTLFAEREKRVHPYKDDKILTDWNGLMIAGFCAAARAFGEPELLKTAEDAARFILKTLRQKDGRLLHRFRAGEAGIPAFLDDYAFFVWGLLELYESTLDAEWLREALRLTGTMIDSFRDEPAGGFFFSADDGEELLARQKEVYDGAIPSGNSVAMMNLLKLGRITANPELEKMAVETARVFGGMVKQAPSAFTQLLCALEFVHGDPMEIIVTGNRDDDAVREFLGIIRSLYIPNKVVIHRPAGEDSAEIDSIAEYLKNYRLVDGKPAVYLCRNYVCEQPVTDAGALRKLLLKKQTTLEPQMNPDESE